MNTSSRHYACNLDGRRAAISEHPTLIGLDFLEVSEDQQELYLHFVPAARGVSKTVIPSGLTPDNVQITGGVRVTRIQVVAVAEDPDAITVTVRDDNYAANGVGDFSPYTLRLVGVSNLDPLFSEVTFSFKVVCPTDLDCAVQRICSQDALPEPEIDYLAKDFASFRRLVFDRLAALQPGWTERNAADLQVTLVELLAYVGDYLSYQQDAVATEAYLGTARRRVSVRRHARLVDYPMHDGSNARVWAHLQVAGDNVKLDKGTQLLTRIANQPLRIAPGSFELDQIPASGPKIFETLHEVELYEAHNELHFYTWGDRECCLPRGATQATLQGAVNTLHEGDYLLLEEVRGPRTGVLEDADPTHRQVVRLTDVTYTSDPLGGCFLDPPTDDPVPVTEVEWADEDALTFPLCVSATTDMEHGLRYVEDVSVARSNVVLADYGCTVHEALEKVPEASGLVYASQGSDIEPLPVRYRPNVKRAPLTQAAPYVDLLPPGPDRQQRFAPATAAMQWSAGDTLPAIWLDADSGSRWLPRRDLLGSDQFATDFVAEVEDDGRAYLRFGDGRFGMRPLPDTVFTATYRVGNGAGGNIGAGSLGHVVSANDAVVGIYNPMPAQGGADPENIEHVRQSAPSAFRTQERAVTADDYARAVGLHLQVQRAAATVRWTGSWRTVFVSVDRLGGADVDAEFERELRLYLDRFRMAGQDVEIEGPSFVFLEVEMLVCAKPDYFRADVKAALLDVFSDRILPDGRRGVFHPDNFTFGQPVYPSLLYAAAQAVEGVASVDIVKLQRLGTESSQALDDGYLSLGRLEIARLDNDPNFPERGIFRLTVEGGK